MTLRQAEEAAKAGRYDEALALASRPDVAEHHHAVQFRDRLAGELLGRAARRGEADDLDGAVDDLALAERLGTPPDALAAARLRLAERVAVEVRGELDAGEPARVVERVDALARRKLGGPALRRTRETAEAWQAALDEARRGEFGRATDHLDRAERLAAGAAAAALAAARRDLEQRQKAAAPKTEALYEALGRGQWAVILNAAEAVLDAVPEHPAARQARARAWQQVAAIVPGAAALPDRGSRVPQQSAPPARDRDARPAAEAGPVVWLGPVSRTQPPQPPPAAADGSGPRGRFLLWADAVGGYLVCLDGEVVLGRAGPEGDADVPLLGDLARRHATLTRDGDGYVLRAEHPAFVNNRRVETAMLRDGDVLRLGSTVELEFRQPSPVSSTAMLTVVSRHRLPLAVDGVLLMADTCIIGASPQSHVRAPGLPSPVVLYRQGADLWCRAAGGFEVDGRPCAARAPLTMRSGVLGEGFSFSLEPLPPRPA